MYGARWWQLDKVFRLALAKCEVGVGGHTSSHVPGIIDWNALVSRDSVTVLRPRTFSEASRSSLLSSRHPPALCSSGRPSALEVVVQHLVRTVLARASSILNVYQSKCLTTASPSIVSPLQVIYM